MSGKRIGERLSGMVPLSGHDIEEILSEQNSTGRRFGDIALQLGFCTPEHVWQAWCNQLAESPQRIDLDGFAIDSQAVAHVSPAVVTRYHIMPLRLMGEELVIAVDEAGFSMAAKELETVLGTKVKFVLSTHRQITQAIRTYYATANAA